MKLDQIADAKKNADELIAVRRVIASMHATAPARISVSCNRGFTPPGESSYQDLTVRLPSDVVAQALATQEERLVSALKAAGVEV